MNKLIKSYLMKKINIKKTEDTDSLDKKIDELLKIKDCDKNKDKIEQLTKNIEFKINEIFKKQNL